MKLLWKCILKQDCVEKRRQNNFHFYNMMENLQKKEIETTTIFSLLKNIKWSMRGCVDFTSIKVIPKKYIDMTSLIADQNYTKKAHQND